MTVPYRVKAFGRLEAELPVRGPCWTGTDCQVVRHDLRPRKTGPPWGWIAVLRCKTHGVSFSAYPPGHYPYGRVPLVDLALDGSKLDLEAEADPLAGTLLEATADASRGERWPLAEAATPPGAVRSTQRRRLLGVATLLGLVAAVEARGVDLELVAEVAQIPAGLLFANSGALKAARGIEALGSPVQNTLERLLSRSGSWLCDRLAILGFLAGCWGPPYRWTLSGGGRLIALGKSFWEAALARRTASRSRDGP